MTPALWLLILFGPFLVIAVLSVPVVASWPELLADLVRPVSTPPQRPVTRPRPARMAVA